MKLLTNYSDFFFYTWREQKELLKKGLDPKFKEIYIDTNIYVKVK